MTHRTTIQLPDDLFDEIFGQAIQNGRSTSSEIVQILRMGLQKQGRGRPVTLELGRLSNSKVAKILEVIAH